MIKEQARKYLCVHCKRLTGSHEECMRCDEGEFFEEITAVRNGDDGSEHCSNCGCSIASKLDMYCCLCGRRFEAKADD